MHTLLRLVPLILLFAVSRADDTLTSARRAQALLGPDVWSRVVRIENTAPDSVYPRTTNALVFEFMGRLWFYCGVNGTQSFSIHAGQLEAEKADFGPLLRDIEPGFTRWKVLAADRTPAGPLENGCFIESLGLLRRRLAEGVPITVPQLLSYYVDTRRGRRGHTVLIYQRGDRLVVDDPARPRHELALPLAAVTQPVAVARALQGAGVVKAQLLPIRLPAPPAVA